MSKRNRTRKEKLRSKLNDIIGANDKLAIVETIKAIDVYENDNLATIEKLKRVKKITTSAINGGLKQSINAHGPITKELIGSTGKRIYGALLSSEQKQKKISIKTLIVGILIGSIITYLIIG